MQVKLSGRRFLNNYRSFVESYFLRLRLNLYLINSNMRNTVVAEFFVPFLPLRLL